MKNDYKKDIFDREGRTFPGKTYAEVVIEPAYNHAKKVLLEPMLAIHKAHLIMLVERDLLKQEEASQIIKGIQSLDLKEIEESSYDPQFEDLFFRVESQIMEISGEIGGSLHLARSRNDMGVAMYRITLRKKLLEAINSVQNFQQTLLKVIDTYKETLVLGYTHTQQAQPMTFSHYLLGMFDVVQRDLKRLNAAYDTCNLSPLGAAALTTTGFSIDRNRVSELLGFSNLVKSAYDAIGGGDYLGEVATAVQLSFINLGRFTQDLLLWATQEFSAIKVSEPYVQISSIMPQKRNPVSLEHIRALSSSGVGNAQTVLQMLHNTPFGDINDTEDDMQPYLWKALTLIDQVFRLSEVVVGTMEVNEPLLKQRAIESFATITELADTLFRESSIPFRTAHTIASLVVKKSLVRGLNASQVTSKLVDEAALEAIGRTLELQEETVKKAMDPEHFIKIRKLTGGPAPEEMSRAIKERQQDFYRQRNRHQEEIKRLKSLEEQLDHIILSWSKAHVDPTHFGH